MPWKRSPSGTKAMRCCHGRYRGLKWVSMSKSSPSRLRISASMPSRTRSGYSSAIFVICPCSSRILRRTISWVHSSGMSSSRQRVGQLVHVAPDEEERRRPLQHGDVVAVRRHGGDQGRGGGARADDDHPLAVVVEVVGPRLRVHDAPLEAVHPGPLGGVALGVAVVALAHPQEAGGEAEVLTRVGAGDLERPERVVARPRGRVDRVLVADVTPRSFSSMTSLRYGGSPRRSRSACRSTA